MSGVDDSGARVGAGAGAGVGVGAAGDATESEDAPDEPVAIEGRVLLVVRGTASSPPRVIDLVDHQEEIVIGRGPDATIGVDDSKVSRRHARIVRRATSSASSSLVLEDLGSRNGTWCSGKTLRSGQSRVISAGDLIRVASTEIIVATASVQPLPLSEQEKQLEKGLGATDAPPPPFEGVVIADPKSAHVFRLARKVARTPTTVLLLGETGAGKEVMAKQIHAWSPRASLPFVRVNCAALPETLLESELFGFERGAFSGADRRKIGFVEAAQGGTLFIDEVGELNGQAQVKLLSMLESRVITRIGSTTEIPVDVRVICATHRDLADDVSSGRFRADLLYRIKAFTIHLPPLRERLGEIRLLTEMFARAFAASIGEEPAPFSPEVLAAFQAHPWPGNVRELRNAVEHALVLADGEDAIVRLEHLPEDIVVRSAPPAFGRVPGGAAAPSAGGSFRTVKSEVAELERRRIEEALQTTSGNQVQAAKLLGISRRTLVYRLARYRAIDRRRSLA